MNVHRLFLDGSEKTLETNGHIDSVKHGRKTKDLIRIVWQENVVFLSSISTTTVFFVLVIIIAGLEGIFLMSISVDFWRTV